MNGVLKHQQSEKKVFLIGIVNSILYRIFSTSVAKLI